ncbi:MAG TPA: hypothetical protein VFE78_15260 [Gemmataceae bacterium]|jgi:hypothetical protein|nr:hypothetical protein [Gemmataceae bacterium]
MARPKAKSSSTAGYFKALFNENPAWLNEGSNAELIERWKKDHPGQEVNKSILNGLANTKSLMRKAMGLSKGRRRKRRKAVAAAADQPVAARKARAPYGVLEKMEGLIDDCLSLARQQNSEGLDNVVKHLRVARRQVAWEMGEPAAARG